MHHSVKMTQCVLALSRVIESINKYAKNPDHAGLFDIIINMLGKYETDVQFFVDRYALAVTIGIIFLDLT